MSAADAAHAENKKRFSACCIFRGLILGRECDIMRVKGENMSKKVQFFIVLSIGFGLAGIVVGAYFLDPSFLSDFYHLTSMIIATLWAFFILPAVLFAIAAGKRYFSRKTPQEAFRVGVFIGVVGFGGLFALCLLASPVTGTMWYVYAIKEIAEKAKRHSKHQNDDDIFQI